MPCTAAASILFVANPTSTEPCWRAYRWCSVLDTRGTTRIPFPLHFFPISPILFCGSWVGGRSPQKLARRGGNKLRGQGWPSGRAGYLPGCRIRNNSVTFFGLGVTVWCFRNIRGGFGFGVELPMEGGLAGHFCYHYYSVLLLSSVILGFVRYFLGTRADFCGFSGRALLNFTDTLREIGLNRHGMGVEVAYELRTIGGNGPIFWAGHGECRGHDLRV